MPITTSIFELFKIGPGPSSSHTIGPMKAALRFRNAILDEVREDELKLDLRIEIILYGSLSATGKGHGTHRAVVAGLLGWEPETIDPIAFNKLFAQKDDCYFLEVKNHHCLIDASSIIYGPVSHEFPFVNTVEFKLLGEQGLILEQRYYSVGGGFIRWDGWEPDAPLKDIPYPYTTMAELKKVLAANPNTTLVDLILANEEAITGLSPAQTKEKLGHIIRVMDDAVRRGLTCVGALPGPIKLNRKASTLFNKAQTTNQLHTRMLLSMNAYSLAASEENAAGNLVVTAPTSGAAGVIPGVLHWLNHDQGHLIDALIEGMLIAACIGFIIKENASISGAEVGCQGEVGSASAMAAALFAHVHGCSVNVIANAAEIALEHHLGMTCDPVGGYVQIPCIERNAMGAIKAYNAFVMASSGDPESQVIDLDKAIKVMYETGKDMSHKYRETSLGGLGTITVNVTEC